jgi:hypothetical protein
MAKVIDVSKFKESEIKERLEKKIEQKKLNKMAEIKGEKGEKPTNPFKGVRFKQNKNNFMDKCKDAEAQMKEDTIKFEHEQRMKQMEKIHIEQIKNSGEGRQMNTYVNDALAYAWQDPIKKEIFKNRLSNNEVIQSHINDAIVYNAINVVNKNLRFGLYLAMECVGTEEDYKRYLYQVNNMRQTGHKKEESKVEEVEEDEEQLNNDE